MLIKSRHFLFISLSLSLVLAITACSDTTQTVEESPQSDEKVSDEPIVDRQGITELYPENVKFGSKPLQVIPGGIQIVNPEGDKVTEYTFGANGEVVLNAVAAALGGRWDINWHENCGNILMRFPTNFSVSVAQDKFVGWYLAGWGGDNSYEDKRTQVRTPDGVGINSLLAEFQAIADVEIAHYPEYSVFEVNEEGMSGFEARRRIKDKKNDISIYGSLDRELGEVYIPPQVEGQNVDSSLETISSLSSGITCLAY